MYDEEKVRENFANMRTEALIDIVKNSRNNFYEKSYLIAVDELKKRTEHGYVDKLLRELDVENNANIDSIKSFTATIYGTIIMGAIFVIILLLKTPQLATYETHGPAFGILWPFQVFGIFGWIAFVGIISLVFVIILGILFSKREKLQYKVNKYAFKTDENDKGK